MSNELVKTQVSIKASLKVFVLTFIFSFIAIFFAAFVGAFDEIINAWAESQVREKSWLDRTVLDIHNMWTGTRPDVISQLRRDDFGWYVQFCAALAILWAPVIAIFVSLVSDLSGWTKRIPKDSHIS